MIPNRTIVSLMFLTSLLGLLAGCAHYESRPLKTLINTQAQNKKAETVSFAYRALTRSECKRYLDRDVISKGYQPLHVTIANNSSHPLSISQATSFSFPCVSAREVASKVHTSTKGRAIGYGVGSLFFFPLVIPAIVDGIGSAEANDKLDDDYADKVLADQIIPAHGSINGLVFVPEESYTPGFTVTLTEPETKKSIVLSPTKTTVTV